jgi:MFS family permease
MEQRMPPPSLSADEAIDQQSGRSRKRILGVTCSVHALHDGFTDVLYVLLPLWQSQFGLSYGMVGVLRALYMGTMAGAQLPAGLAARVLGRRKMLALGTAIAGAGFLVAGFAGSVIGLSVGLLLSGLGSSTQHPIASSLVSGAYEGSQSRSALATYNFAGDIGKVLLPGAAGLLLAAWSWQSTVVLVGVAGLIGVAAILIALPADDRRPAAEKPHRDNRARSEGQGGWDGFAPLLAVGIVDTATRMGFLTFMPFLLQRKGAGVTTLGLALTLTFMGGAAGKLVCGMLGARIGVLRTVWLTAFVTTGGIIAILFLPLAWTMAVLVIVGLSLNGTSSVLYGTVPELVPDDKHEKGFGIFYTGAIGAGAIAPILYGWVGDTVDIPRTMGIIAAAGLLTLPLTWLVDRSLAKRAMARA